MFMREALPSAEEHLHLSATAAPRQHFKMLQHGLATEGNNQGWACMWVANPCYYQFLALLRVLALLSTREPEGSGD